MKIRLLLSATLLNFLAAAAVAVADDWPTYRHDNARSGVTAEKLDLPLAETWVYKSRHAPTPAWEAPRGVPVEGFLELPRVRFDDAFHTVSVGDAIYFGSSADNKVYCLDAASGRVRWTFFTGGPVRLAPTVADGRVYVGSDDGFVYCLAAKDGRAIWQRRVGLNDQQLLGHGKMVSMWPVRTGVLVDEGTAYYGAGLFPAEGVYVESARAADGQVLWRNDTGGESAEARMSPQGYLLATSANLFVPQGRASPMAFERADGKRIYEAFFGKNIGGTSAQIADDTLYSGTEEILGYDAATKRKVSWFNGRKVVVTLDIAYVTTTNEMLALSRQGHAAASLVQLNIRDEREKLKQSATTPKKERTRLKTAIQLAQEKLAGLSKQMEALSANDPKRAALEKERADAEQALKADEEKLEATELKIADVERQTEALKPKFDAANEAINQTVKWRMPCQCADALILAGNVLFGGGKGEVIAVHANTGEKLWSAKVSGTAKGLAVANGRLFVSTDAGAIHCFTPGKTIAPPRVVTGATRAAATPQDRLGAAYAAAADAIVRESGVKRGYCLVLGCPTGRLAMELAKRTSLKFICVEPDAQKAVAARKALDAAGLYGARVTVDQGSLDRLPYASYFANLIVSESAVLGWLPSTPAKEWMRMLKPCGGVAIIGQPSEAHAAAPALEPAKVREWLQGAELPVTAADEARGKWARVTRGPLPGAGAWTHEYGNAANTTCSDDKFVKCPLGLLWFGDPGPLQMVSRHRRAASPLAVNGVLFVQGENAVNAYDAYNGLKLWDRKIPSVVRMGVSNEPSNLAADRESFFVVSSNKCLRLEAATGAVRATFAVPPAVDGAGRQWGHIAIEDGILLGTAGRSNFVSDAMFAYDIASARLLWTRTNEIIQNSAISIADRRVYFADTGAKLEQPADAAAAKAPAKKTKKKAAASPRAAEKHNPIRNVVALDLKTGREVWSETYDLSGCIGGSYFGTLGSMVQDGVLVFFGVFTDGHFWKDFFAKQFESRRIVALNAESGQTLWAKNIAYRVRPLVVGDTLHAEPWAFKLKSGDPVMRVSPITGREEAWQFARPGHHCGAPAASPNVMAFRSYYLGYYDLTRDSGTVTFGGQRPGCWINFIFGNGLLTMPEASSGCMCPFPNMCTVALAPRDEDRTWAKYSLSGETKPVKHLALNLGGPGDRRDAAGTLWLGYPRPTGSLVLPLQAKVEVPRGGSGYFAQSADSVRIEGTRDPWLYTFGCKDVRIVELPLLDSGDGNGRYTVRLGFAELDDAKPGERVFDIALQKKPVLKSFDVVKEAGGPRKAVVKEFKGVDVDEDLLIEFKPPTKQGGGKLAPILQTVEVVRERMLSVGVSAPSFVLSDKKPEQTAELRVSNQTDNDFAGTLRITAPEGFAVEPAETPVNLAVGKRMQVALKATVAKQKVPSRYPAKMQLLRRDGTVEAERTLDIDYMGRGGRVVFKAAEDAHIIHMSPTMNYGTAPVMLVDGGAHVMGDDHHQTAYLKFPLNIPGKPTSARLRLYNAGNESTDGGNICLVTTPWKESEITYASRPKSGEVVGHVGPIKSKEIRDLPLKLSLEGLKELSLAIEPVNCDGVNYLSREGNKPAELVVEYEQE
ncbi:MAG: PQQ-binding-like beta-propeller repeat protein [Verrucomicrobia bacterium]|nr:PQQ-binding-like beta-propeller repeat protein [Verrucomicrobiota bacterium]